MRRLILCIILSAVLAGCGKKGALVPPEALVPAAVTDLRLAQKGEYFQLSWSRPDKEESGRRLTGLAGFELLRREVLPAGQQCDACPFALLKSIDLDYPQEVRRYGDLLLFNDNQVSRGTSYQYKVLSRKKDGSLSRDSNQVRRQKVEPPLPPVLQATSQSAGITLDIAAPTLPPGAVLVGFNIYRWRAGEPVPPFPLNDRPLTGSSFEDLRLKRGETYIYGVCTVARVAGEEVESQLSSQVTGALTEPD